MSEEKKKQMPKGGRKGGRQFPQISLKDAVEYAKKLVSKTHTGPQPDSIILPGVFGSGTSRGGVRAAAMKQFGLMDGTADAYKASDLAKSIVAAPPEELPLLLRTAVLKPEIFKSLYETFKSDKVSTAKIKQQASNLEVHPDNVDKCVSLFLESVQFAGLGQINGEDVTLIAATVAEAGNIGDKSHELLQKQESSNGTENKVEAARPPMESVQQISDPQLQERPASGRSVIHVNIGLDSSLDTDKLEKQLALLRRYGAI